MGDGNLRFETTNVESADRVDPWYLYVLVLVMHWLQYCIFPISNTSVPFPVMLVCYALNFCSAVELCIVFGSLQHRWEVNYSI